MSQVGEKFLCDGCGRDVGNAGLQYCAVLGRIVGETGMAENLHFCNDYEKGGKTLKGCSSKMLSTTRLTAYHEREAKRAAQEKKTTKKTDN